MFYVINLLGVCTQVTIAQNIHGLAQILEGKVSGGLWVG